MAPNAKFSSIKAFFIANLMIKQALSSPVTDFYCAVFVLSQETIPSEF